MAKLYWKMAKLHYPTALVEAWELPYCHNYHSLLQLRAKVRRIADMVLH
jgi:hypothetical protein